MEKMTIKRTINGEEQEIKLTDEEIYQAYLVQQKKCDTEKCREFLDSIEQLDLIENEIREEFLGAMTEIFRKNVANGRSPYSGYTYMESFWEAYSKIEPHVDVAGNPYTIRDMYNKCLFRSDVLPINKAAAKELFGKVDIYVLKQFISDILIQSIEEFDRYNDEYDMFGVLKEDWEAFDHKDDLPAIL